MAKVIGTASDILVAIRDWAKGKFVAKETGKGLSTNDLTSTLKSNYDTAYTNSHTHSNKSVLDGITSTKVTEWNGAIPSSQKGVANGVATLGTDGKVPSSQLPSYVDDVLEYDNKNSFPTTGETGKIYVAKNNNIVYRWSGSAYVEISASLALGETSSTAYRGDRGKIAYDHSQSAHAPSNAQANVIETVKVNGTALTPSSKAVDISVPTNTNQLTNGAGFITASSTAVTNKVVANGAITGATKCKITYDSKGLVTGGADLTANDIPSITKSKISDFPTSMTPSSHTHGNITNDGKLATASRAVVTGTDQKITVSNVTSTELGYLSGVTSAIQTQLNGKANANQALLTNADDQYVVDGDKSIVFGDPDGENGTRIEINNSTIDLFCDGNSASIDIVKTTDGDGIMLVATSPDAVYLNGFAADSAMTASRASRLYIDGSYQELSFMTATEMTNILNS